MMIRGGSTAEVDNDADDTTAAAEYEPDKTHDERATSATIVAVDTDSDGIEDNISKDEDDDEDEEEQETETESSTESSTINQRVALSIQTNWGSRILDLSLELEAARSKNIRNIKERVAKQMPGRPPVLGLQFVYEGRVLDDDVLLDELFDDDDDDVHVDDDDDEEEGGKSSSSTKILILNVVPPVEPHFAVELESMISPHSVDDNRTLTTEDLINAYFLNQLAMTRNAELLANPDSDASSSSSSLLSSPVMRLQMRHKAEQLKQQLQREIPTEIWKKAVEPVPKHTEEYRGNRYRSGRGGAKTNFRRSLQTNFNVVR